MSLRAGGGVVGTAGSTARWLPTTWHSTRLLVRLTPMLPYIFWKERSNATSALGSVPSPLWIALYK